MIRSKLALAGMLVMLPATALAQTLPGQVESAKWALPALLLAAGLLLGVGFGLRGNRWTRGIGVVVWLLLVTVTACATGPSSATWVRRRTRATTAGARRTARGRRSAVTSRRRATRASNAMTAQQAA